jgi:hypothetical protein
MPQVLARHVRARGAQVVPGQRFDEVTTGPLEYGASIQVDPASRFGLRVSDERHHPALRSDARDDVYMIRKNRHLVDVYLAARCRCTNCCSHDIDVGAPKGALP